MGWVSPSDSSGDTTSVSLDRNSGNDGVSVPPPDVRRRVDTNPALPVAHRKEFHFHRFDTFDSVNGDSACHDSHAVTAEIVVFRLFPVWRFVPYLRRATTPTSFSDVIRIEYDSSGNGGVVAPPPSLPLATTGTAARHSPRPSLFPSENRQTSLRGTAEIVVFGRLISRHDAQSRPTVNSGNRGVTDDGITRSHSDRRSHRWNTSVRRVRPASWGRERRGGSAPRRSR